MKELNKFLIKNFHLKPVYTYPCKLNCILKLQTDQIKKVNKLNSVYTINCDRCYVGQSQRLVSTRRDEHLRNIIHDPKNHNVITKHILSNPYNKHNID